MSAAGCAPLIGTRPVRSGPAAPVRALRQARPLAARFALLALMLLSLAGGCSREPATRPTALKFRTTAELEAYLLAHPPEVARFRARGPFDVTVREDQEIRLSKTERITADLFLAAPADAAALVVLLHGHDSTKEDHSYQARHLASWGIHCLVPQLPAGGPWVGNGRALARLVGAIRQQPALVDGRVDAGRIVLAGHSFGGSAVGIALGAGAPAAGGVLLDPAGIGKALPRYLSRIKRPVIVLGADETVFEARDREYFYQFIRSGIAEVSIKGANHEDAQFPAEIPGIEIGSTEALRITFVSALTAAAFSLAATGNLDYAWTSLGDAISKGEFIDARRKPRR